jgi:hypothetical protein
MMDARMLALSASLAGAAISLIVSVGVLIFVVPRLLNLLHGSHVIKHGRPAEGRVRAISQTGLFLNEVPQMQMIVSVRDADGEHEVTIKQFIDLGNIPRAGEHVRLLIDAIDGTRAAYVAPILPDTAP